METFQKLPLSWGTPFTQDPFLVPSRLVISTLLVINRYLLRQAHPGTHQQGLTIRDFALGNLFKKYAKYGSGMSFEFQNVVLFYQDLIYFYKLTGHKIPAVFCTQDFIIIEEPHLWYWQETRTYSAFKEQQQQAGYVAFLKFTGAKLRTDKTPITLDISVDWDPEVKIN